MVYPIKGITKWNTPTNPDIKYIFFLGMFKRPYARDKVKASILRDNPINKSVIISKKCHLLNYSDI